VGRRRKGLRMERKREKQKEKGILNQRKKEVSRNAENTVGKYAKRKRWEESGKRNRKTGYEEKYTVKGTRGKVSFDSQNDK
jgi:hypothetical protein